MFFQTKFARCRIVRDYLDRLDDDTLRLVCYMFTQGYTDWQIRRQLRLSRPKFREIRAEIAQGLLDAGIILRSE